MATVAEEYRDTFLAQYDLPRTVETGPRTTCTIRSVHVGQDGGLYVFATYTLDGVEQRHPDDGVSEAEIRAFDPDIPADTEPGVQLWRGYNLPVLIEDPEGDVVRVRSVRGGGTVETRYRRDVLECARRELAQTVLGWAGTL
ncbi:hypothetical protein [Mycolicibacterium sp.]|uniref:hypothetical protein n=1 Tax=Mycolicibacterium sp. TaxID=2320850 RepID=UPI00355D722E